MQHEKNETIPIVYEQLAYVLYCVEQRGLFNLLHYI